MVGLIVHEWIAEHGGSENVLDVMARTYPTADIHCLWNDSPSRFQGRNVTETWLAKTPLRRSKVAALPFMSATWTHTKVDSFDFVLVSSHLFAHHVGGNRKDGGPAKYVYVHTPARYIWSPELDTRGASWMARLASPRLRRMDLLRAQSSGAQYAANSQFVRERIRATWDQDASVLYPPVGVARIQSVSNWRDKLASPEQLVADRLPAQFILGASRFVSYKRLDLVIKAGEAVGLPVVLAGSGPQRPELVAMAEAATVPVQIVERPSDELLYALYQAATAFVFPSIEDFGIMPVEAMALGTPVIVGNVGGAVESVMAVQGGAVADSFDTVGVRQAMDVALRQDMKAAARSTEQFSESSFTAGLHEWIDSPTGRATMAGDGNV